MHETFRVPDVPYSDTRVAHHNASQTHELSLQMQQRVKDFVRNQVTVGMDATREIYADWFSRIGLRPRFKERAMTRIRDTARRIRAASFSIS